VNGDRVEIVIDAGATRPYEIQATPAGRRVELSPRLAVVEVTVADATMPAASCWLQSATRFSPHRTSCANGADAPTSG
jgi:hypothetical protein